MSKKKILIFIDWYLPGFKAGGPIQSVANLVDHFKDEFEFSIITSDTDYCETIPYPNIKSNEWNTMSNGIKVYYFSKDQLTRSNIRNLIRKTEYDIVYLNGIYSLYFTLIPLYLLRKKHNKQIIVAARGMLSEGSLSVKKTKKQFFIRAIKILKLFDKVVFHATTEVEKGEIGAVFSGNVIIKIAVNLPQRILIKKLPVKVKTVGSVQLINVARVAPEKNLLLALQILKNVKAIVVFDFYGPIYDQEYWSKCLRALDELPNNVTANYKGSIESNKVFDVLEKSHFMFMPTSGENFGHIILQSLSVGCPVIISDQTPWKQLKNKNVGWDIPLKKLDEYVECIEKCAEMNQEEYDFVSKSAFGFAQQYTNNPAIVEQNRDLFL